MPFDTELTRRLGIRGTTLLHGTTVILTLT
jgi:hypothetical protein